MRGGLKLGLESDHNYGAVGLGWSMGWRVVATKHTTMVV